MAPKAEDDDDLMEGVPASDRKVRRTDNSTGGVAAGQLRSFIERIERLEEEKKGIADDIRDIYAEAKGNGFDTKALRTIVKERKKDKAQREEEEAVLDLYRHALGMI